MSNILVPAAGRDRFGNSMNRALVIVSLSLLGLAGCCHLNRLAGGLVSIRTVEYEALVEEQAVVRFVGHRSLASRPGLEPVGIWGYTEDEYTRRLAGLVDTGELAADIAERAPQALGGPLGWSPPAEDDAGDALLRLQVQSVCFYAEDALAPVEIRMSTRVTLTGRDSGEVLWRDCLEWVFPQVYESLLQLSQLDSSRLRGVFGDLADRFLARLAGHLAAEAGVLGPRPGISE